MCVLGLKASQSPHTSENEDGGEGETELKSPHLHTNTALEQTSQPKVNLLHILQQGWELRSVWTLAAGGISGFCREHRQLVPSWLHICNLSLTFSAFLSAFLMLKRSFA